MLTRKSSPTSPLIVDIAAFRGTVTPSIVGAWTDDCAHLTCRNGVRTQLDRSYSISLVGRVGKLCLVLLILVVIAGYASRAPIGLGTLLCCRQVAQLDDGMIKALYLAVVMLQYLIWRAVFSIVDIVRSRVRNSGKLQNAVSETYPRTEKVIIV